MPYTYVLTATIPASAQKIYQTWLDSAGHSEMTGADANMSDKAGAQVSAWDGYISGRNLELIPGRRIVQSWRTSEFTDEHADSVITVLLEDVGDGALLTLEHKNVPDDQRSYQQGGWQSNYFEPMVAYFQRKQKVSRVPAKKSAAKSSPKTARKSANKAKRAPSTKSKRAGAPERAKLRRRKSARRKRK